jgi:hypothetical protein
MLYSSDGGASDYNNSEVVVDERERETRSADIPCVYYVMNVRVCVKKRNIPAIQSSTEQRGKRYTRSSRTDSFRHIILGVWRRFLIRYI